MMMVVVMVVVVVVMMLMVIVIAIVIVMALITKILQYGIIINIAMQAYNVTYPFVLICPFMLLGRKIPQTTDGRTLCNGCIAVSLPRCRSVRLIAVFLQLLLV